MNNRGRQFSKNAQGRSGRGRRKGNLKWLSLGIVFMVLVIAAPLMINGILSNMGKALMVSAEEHLPAAGAQPTQEAVWVYYTESPAAAVQPTAASPTAQPAESPAAETTGESDGGRVIDPNQKMVALTFDDGPYTPVTKRIVKTLEAYNGRGTFFVVGNRVEDYSKILKRAYDGGHQIATHTWSHKNLKKLSEHGVAAQVTKSMEAIKSVTGENPTLLRPPYGAVDKTVKQRVKDAGGLALVNWSVDSKDWKYKNADTIVKTIMDNVKDGDIVLMHDLYESTAEAVEKLVPKLVEKGYQLVTVEELYTTRGDTLEAGTLHFKNPPGPD